MLCFIIVKTLNTWNSCCHPNKLIQWKHLQKVPEPLNGLNHMENCPEDSQWSQGGEDTEGYCWKSWLVIELKSDKYVHFIPFFFYLWER